MAISDQEKKMALIEICRHIQPALSQIAAKAQEQLGHKQSSSSGNSLAVPINAMVGDRIAERNIHLFNLESREHLKQLATEPFHSRIVVQWE